MRFKVTRPDMSLGVILGAAVNHFRDVTDTEPRFILADFDVWEAYKIGRAVQPSDSDVEWFQGIPVLPRAQTGKIAFAIGGRPNQTDVVVQVTKASLPPDELTKPPTPIKDRIVYAIDVFRQTNKAEPLLIVMRTDLHEAFVKEHQSWPHHLPVPFTIAGSPIAVSDGINPNIGFLVIGKHPFISLNGPQVEEDHHA